MAREVLTHSDQETRELAASLEYRPGEVILLEGELGAGKTTFVKGLAKKCGVTAMVRSPTFALMHRYRGNPDVVHLDLYREQHAVGLEDLDLDEERDAVVIVVEWPKGLTDRYWPDAKVIRIEYARGENGRKITLP